MSSSSNVVCIFGKYWILIYAYGQIYTNRIYTIWFTKIHDQNKNSNNANNKTMQKHNLAWSFLETKQNFWST